MMILLKENGVPHKYPKKLVTLVGHDEIRICLEHYSGIPCAITRRIQPCGDALHRLTNGSQSTRQRLRQKKFVTTIPF